MSANFRDFPCDVCWGDAASEIPSLMEYTGGKPIHVCKNCGFVYVRRRRTAKTIADIWSKELSSCTIIIHDDHI